MSFESQQLLSGVMSACRTSTHSFRNSFDKGERPTPQGEADLQVFHDSCACCALCSSAFEHKHAERSCLSIYWLDRVEMTATGMVQGCTIQASEEDSRKFYVNDHGKQMKLRAESEYDTQLFPALT